MLSYGVLSYGVFGVCFCVCVWGLMCLCGFAGLLLCDVVCVVCCVLCDVLWCVLFCIYLSLNGLFVIYNVMLCEFVWCVCLCVFVV